MTESAIEHNSLPALLKNSLSPRPISNHLLGVGLLWGTLPLVGLASGSVPAGEGATFDFALLVDLACLVTVLATIVASLRSLLPAGLSLAAAFVVSMGPQQAMVPDLVVMALAAATTWLVAWQIGRRRKNEGVTPQAMRSSSKAPVEQPPAQEAGPAAPAGATKEDAAPKAQEEPTSALEQLVAEPTTLDQTTSPDDSTRDACDETGGVVISEVPEDYLGPCRLDCEHKSRLSAVFGSRSEAMRAAEFAVSLYGGFHRAVVSDGFGLPITHASADEWIRSC